MTLPDMDRRIEAAAKESAVLMGDPENAWMSHVHEVEPIIRAAFPELFNPPTHWLAPWEIDGEMVPLDVEILWGTIRDAYLKEPGAYLKEPGE